MSRQKSNENTDMRKRASSRHPHEEKGRVCGILMKSKIKPKKF